MNRDLYTHIKFRENLIKQYPYSLKLLSQFIAYFFNINLSDLLKSKSRNQYLIIAKYIFILTGTLWYEIERITDYIGKNRAIYYHARKKLSERNFAIEYIRFLDFLLESKGYKFDNFCEKEFDMSDKMYELKEKLKQYRTDSERLNKLKLYLAKCLYYDNEINMDIINEIVFQKIDPNKFELKKILKI